MKFRKKPVVVDAVQWTGANSAEITEFLGYLVLADSGALLIRTLEGEMRANQGDWIIKGVAGEFYPCKPDIFEATYDPDTVKAV